jgi:hypothetical protein
MDLNAKRALGKRTLPKISFSREATNFKSFTKIFGLGTGFA